jgi:hypothetical protein
VIEKSEDPAGSDRAPAWRQQGDKSFSVIDD